MNQPVNQPNPLDLASINARLMADKACDEIEKHLLAGESVDWSDAFAKVDSSIWGILVDYLIEFLRASEIVDSDTSILSLFEKAPSEIHQMVAQQLAVTVRNMDAESVEDSHVVEDFVPEMIDHFRIEKQIGLGGFGRVLLAQDMMLQKEVVLKIPRRTAMSNEKSLSAFVEEARKASMIESKGIVPINHIGTFSGIPYIVQPYIRGGDLHQALATRQFTFDETASIVADIATTIAEAHQKRLLHRDLKPANILLDDQGRPLVTDFGLAIHESRQYEARGEFAGSINYMSPEQVNGETHHMDGRSDIWSLGVILYQMLVNELPFRAPSKSLMRSKICQKPPRPPRQLNRAVPQELERICLKCLSIRMTDRYGNGHDLALELREWLLASKTADGGQSKSLEPEHASDFLANSASIPQSVIPRGLMAFSEQDETFFLSLLPGARTRDGIPEKLQYWLRRISLDQDQSPFSVGLIYGPSGCGKSSFVKAGLLPRLPRKVHAIYIESTDSDTEAHLLATLRKHFPDLPRNLELPDVLAELREGDWLQPDEKLLIVLDQFEQWLHMHEICAGLPLIEALRQCDGTRLQAIVLVRAEFWMKITQFFHALEIQISQQENYQGLDLFDTQHAKRVLAAFGRAYERLPADGSLTASQEQFLDEAIKRLAELDKIICIHLVMLVETVKDKPWEVDSLPRSGHLHQIGVQFLEQCLSGSSANPAFRYYHSAICRVLSLMLPVEGTDIKARFRNREHLANASGFGAGSKDFATVLDILEKQLKLVSATDPDIGQSNADAQNLQATDTRYYQLTHDFLVPSVRQWLEQRQSETPAGRAKLRLKALASGYEQSSDNRFIPTRLEFLSIARHVRIGTCKQTERKIYWKALTRYSAQVVLVAGLFMCLAYIGHQVRESVRKQRADSWVTTWINADPAALPNVLQSRSVDIGYVVDSLRARKEAEHLPASELVRINLALALNSSAEKSVFQNLVSYVSDATFAELPLLRRAFANDESLCVPLLEKRLKGATADDDEIAAKLALILLHLQRPEHLVDNCLEIRTDQFRHLFAVRLIGLDIDEVKDYFPTLRAACNQTEQPTGRSDQLAGIVKGLGGKDWNKATPEIQQQWRSLLIDLLNKSTSGPMHSAAYYALERIGESPQALLKDPPSCPTDSWNWYAAPSGLTFVRVPAAHKKLSIHPRHKLIGLQGEMPLRELDDFWISITEVPCRVYEQCRIHNGLALNQVIRIESGNRPISGISILEAIRWCNALSKSEELTPYYFETEEAFQFTQEDGVSPDTVPADLHLWTINPNANGYRIPDIEELFFTACRESKTAFPNTINSANTRMLVNDYCWYVDNKGEITGNLNQEVGLRMPNDLGVFDILGNVAELSLTSREGKLVAWQPIFRVNSNSTLQEVIVPYQVETALWSNLKTSIGFRIVRSQPKISPTNLSTPK